MKLCRRVFHAFYPCIIALLLLSEETLGQSEADPSGSRWTHLGSTIRLFADGRIRRFHYETPSPETASSVQKGEILFDGVAKAMRYEGTAYTFSAKCGRAPFRVEGPISQDYRRVTLRGKSPKRGEDCKTVEHTDVTWTFDFKEKVSPAAQAESDVYVRNQPDDRKGFAARTYLQDPASRNELVLDWLNTDALEGELLNKDGDLVASVSGKNPRPRTLELVFRGLNGADTRATYVWLVNEYDDTRVEILNLNREFLQARWQRVHGPAATPASLLDCPKSCKIGHDASDNRFDFRFYDVVSWRGTSFRSQNAGEVCVRPTADGAKAALTVLKSNGFDSKFDRRNHGCEDGYVSIDVPIGLEKWAVETLKGSGKVRDATYGYGTSGGSGTVTQEFSPGTFVPVSLTPHTQNEAWKQSACKLKTALKRSFNFVDVKPCSKEAKLSQCFLVVLEGHTADEGGFSRNLDRLLDNKFLVHAELQFYASPILTEFSPVKYVDRLEWHVIESKYARQTRTASSATSVFREIEHFQLGVSSAVVDHMIAAVVQQLIMTNSPPSCSTS